MFGRTKTEKLTNENIVFDFVKGLLVATLLSLGLVVLFAFCMKWFSIPDEFITPATLLIKGLSALVGSILAVKGNSKGLLKGMTFGAIYIVLAFVIFSILAGTFDIGLGLVLDLAFASLLSGIVGIVKVNKNQ